MKATADPRWSRRWLAARWAAVVQVVLLLAVVVFCIVVLAMAAADPARDTTGLVAVFVSVGLFLMVAPTILALVALVLVLRRRQGGLVLMVLYALVATLTCVLFVYALSAGTDSISSLAQAIAFPVVWGLLALGSGVVALLTLRVVRKEPEPDRFAGTNSLGIAGYRGARARRRRPR